MNGPVLFGVPQWVTENWPLIAGSSTLLSILAALPKVGPPVRSFLRLALRTLPPVAGYAIAAETERANIEKQRAEMYRASLAELNEEVARLRAALESSDASSASPTNRRPRSTTTRSSEKSKSTSDGSTTP